MSGKHNVESEAFATELYKRIVSVIRSTEKQDEKGEFENLRNSTRIKINRGKFVMVFLPILAGRENYRQTIAR